MKLQTLTVLLTVLGASAAIAEENPDVANTSFVASDGTRTLQESVVVNAPVAALWKAFTDTDEFKKWNSPVAAIDLRVGGSLEASYDPKRKLGDPDNIKHRIITFLPERLIVFQNIQAPHELPNRELFQQTVTVLQYEPLGASQTRVTLSSTGYGAGDGFARLYTFFADDNAELLEKLKKTYEAGDAAAKN
jgi:uncharacterized protein YndB with AHSA1/START domain